MYGLGFACSYIAQHLAAGTIGLTDGGNDLLLDEFDIVGIGGGGFLVGKFLNERRCVVILAGLDHAERA